MPSESTFGLTTRAGDRFERAVARKQQLVHFPRCTRKASVVLDAYLEAGLGRVALRLGFHPDGMSVGGGVRATVAQMR